ncbi:hypothetical protein WICPIJ_006017 [Wickerhamomyces pijperi]|uniref:Uncharacterized protein n=1 Tax=Wickerhamomyces pijperi TaxID=599730 RepID=A0A9P8TKK5_WICPI|nr:hypothetical protein WICPIJ_006017 [Wickerhamomyces pijperi]
MFGVFTTDDDIVDLQDHSCQLRSQQQLLLLTDQRIDNEQLLHVVAALTQTINTQVGATLFDLLGLDVGQSLNRIQPGVLSQGHWDLIKGVGKGTERVLVDTGLLFRGFRDSKRARDLSGTTTVDDSAISDQVSNDTQGVVEGSLGFVDDHLVGTSDETGDGTGVGAFLNDKHTVLGGTELHLINLTGRPQLVRGQVIESGNDTTVSGNSDQL